MVPLERRPRSIRTVPTRPIIERAAAIIRRGGLVAFPTETVYGLGANALDEAAVRSIFAAKRRALDDPLIVHVASTDDLATVAADLPPIARALADRFWPGPLTLVLPKLPAVPDVATAGLPTVAVRVPSHPVAQALIRAAGRPDRRAKRQPVHPRQRHHRRARRRGPRRPRRPDPGRRAGPARHRVDGRRRRRRARPACSGPAPPPRKRSPTPSRRSIRRSRCCSGAVGRTASPGLMAKHYSPRASLFLLTGEPSETRPALRRAVERGLDAGRSRRRAARRRGRPAPRRSPRPDRGRPLGSEADLGQVAGRLFAAMRTLDAAGCEAIYVRALGTSGLGLAILDRLTRAAHPEQHTTPPSS